jgi:antitoxin ParD1/3/4
MANLNLTLPDDMQAFVEAEAARRGFDTVDAYLRAVIRDAQEQEARRSRVDALLLEGLDSGPATPLVDSDWDDIIRRLEERHAARQGGPDAAPKPRGR